MNNQKRREQLYGLLGKLPTNLEPIQVTKVLEQEHEHYTLEKLHLELNGSQTVPAYFLRSKTGGTKAPTILYNHSHGGFYTVGKDELLTPAPYMQKPSYGETLTQQGFSVLCIDCWAFGERSDRTESETFKEMLWKGQSMWGMMVYDSLRALDYLVARPDVDPTRIGTLGMSMGSSMAWWLAALDTRIKVTIDICCLTDYETLLDERGLDRHGVYYYVPDLLNHFTTAQINALIAPRPHLSLAGNLDKLTPFAGLTKIDNELKKVYLDHNATDAWKLLRYDVGHIETEEMRKESISFLRKWL